MTLRDFPFRVVVDDGLPADAVALVDITASPLEWDPRRGGGFSVEANVVPILPPGRQVTVRGIVVLLGKDES